MTTKNSPEPFYSLARRAGDTLYLSGFGPVDSNLTIVGANIEEQTIFTMDLMKAVLESEGATFDDVVRVNVFLLNMADRDGFNTAYLRYFSGRMPTRRLIGAGDLFKGILVEIDCIAYLGDQDQGRAR
ncbi:MAG: RidA family protein [Chloroflexi bacterium]|nr:RidA family protein [Chloroflexota bacterium]